MYQCRNCGGGLKFDIPTQKLKCTHCETLVDPYSLDADADNAGADEQYFYNVTVFTCPHCGGEILSTETSAAEFCSFCGASTVLNSRIRRERRPNYIIPFRITKDECKIAYHKFIGRSFFAPAKLKNPESIDSFRGIYMPYWTYYITQEGPTWLKGEDSHRSGDYIITDHFDLHFTIDSYYKGLSYDASSSFYDSISQAIAPFDVKDMRAFHPAVISGFYADTADVDASVYKDDALTYANESTCDVVRKVREFSGISITMPNARTQGCEVFKTQCRQIDNTMFPVWFMSYRRGNRVAYATVNGQTGKVAADFPVSIFKYILCSLAISIPIFLLFTLLFTFKATTTLGITCVLSLVSSIIYASEISSIARKDSFVDDKGVMFKHNRTIDPVKGGTHNKNVLRTIFIVVFCTVGSIIIAPFLFGIISELSSSMRLSPVLVLITLAGTIIATVTGTRSAKKRGMKAKAPGFACSLSTLAVSFLIAIINPVSDLYYYIVVFFALIMTILLNIGIIRKYNVLATRKLPQFYRSGGDDRA